MSTALQTKFAAFTHVAEGHFGVQYMAPVLSLVTLPTGTW